MVVDMVTFELPRALYDLCHHLTIYGGDAAPLEKHERAHVMQLLGKRSVSSVCDGLSCCPKAKKPKKQ